MESKLIKNLVVILLLAVTQAIDVPAPSSLRTNLKPPGEAAWGCSSEPGSNRGSWINTVADPSWRNVVQINYNVQIFASDGSLILDSGIVNSSEQEVTFNITLSPEQQYTWRVRTTLAYNGTALPQTAWSLAASFETAPSVDSWAARGAQWIGGYAELRADFQVSASPITRARAYVAGLGAFYLFVNGQQVGDHVMDPPQTVYPKRVLYSILDVTPLLVNGFNAVGALLGNYK